MPRHWLIIGEYTFNPEHITVYGIDNSGERCTLNVQLSTGTVIEAFEGMHEECLEVKKQVDDMLSGLQETDNQQRRKQ